MSASESKQIIRDYFDAIRTGDPKLSDLLTEGVSWWVPPGSDYSGLHEGKSAVLEFLGGGVGYYAEDTPLEIEIQSMIAEDDKVACEFTITGKTARGRDYHNFYHFAFEIEAGRIHRVREHLDTRYAYEAFHG